MMDAECLYICGGKVVRCLHSLKVKTSVWFCIMYVYHSDDNKDDDAMMIDFNIFGYVIYTTGEKCIRKKNKK